MSSPSVDIEKYSFPQIELISDLGCKFTGDQIIFGETKIILERGGIAISSISDFPGTEIFIDSIMGYRLGHSDNDVLDRVQISLDFILFLIEKEMDYNWFQTYPYHPNIIGYKYIADRSHNNDMLTKKLYELIDHKYDQLIEDEGGDLGRLRKIKSANNMLKKLMGF